jgi:2-oxoglutarate dehydrogenase E1 component
MTTTTMQTLWQSSVLDGGNSAYLEELYELYLSEPTRIPPEWRHYFDTLPSISAQEISHWAIQQSFLDFSKKRQYSPVIAGDGYQMRVQQLIQAYRLQGHQMATTGPIPFYETPVTSELTLDYHGFTEADRETLVEVGDFIASNPQMTLGALENALKQAYCGPVATEYLHIVSKQERDFIQERVEGVRPPVTPDTQKRLLQLVNDAEGLERYLGTKYPGAKRFGIEGGDAFLIILDELIQRGGAKGIKEAVIGMAHRGRLNVLVNTFGKRPSNLFAEFEGHHDHEQGNGQSSGDVKYHQGFSADVKTPQGPVHLSLAFNPSHLEIVTPVVMGSVRAREQRMKDTHKSLVLSIAVHGDASFAGQGVIMETLNMSQTRGYGVGGTVHIIINNQVGFTTSNPKDARSTLYCSDVAKVIQAPIFHVNADDPEAVLWVSQLALDYKMTFQKDVIVDFVCYRRHGHNEADEPSATQPLMYRQIRQHPTVRELYGKQLVEKKVLTSEEVEGLVRQNRDLLDKGDCVAPHVISEAIFEGTVNWAPYRETDWRVKANTALNPADAKTLAKALITIPNGFVLHPRVAKVMDDRKQMAEGKLPCDWGFAENMAYAGLLQQKFDVRISGQDVGRGTFFHRHAVLHCQKTGKTHTALSTINPEVNFTVIDSLLSEEAVLAFEYGYASTTPTSLVIWEAQFGDFANGAQVVIDQFISSGEQKWGRLCGLVMLLPHGYEGQGPEHSSARLERYLQLCAEHNIQVCVPSTPAQVFHMLRRQMLRNIRRPLVVMSPKSLLRHKDAVSSLEALTSGQFEPILNDEHANPDYVTRVVLCSGKVYYDLHQARLDKKNTHVAIVRIEQLYPFPEPELESLLTGYPKVKEVVWCQEEPQNQGAWYASQHHMRACLTTQQFRYAGRAASASPAAGYSHDHQEQQIALVNQALD